MGPLGDSFQELIAEVVATDALKGCGIGTDCFFLAFGRIWLAEWFLLLSVYIFFASVGNCGRTHAA